MKSQLSSCRVERFVWIYLTVGDEQNHVHYGGPSITPGSTLIRSIAFLGRTHF
jgi:hypothetical protein